MWRLARDGWRPLPNRAVDRFAAQSSSEIAVSVAAKVRVMKRARSPRPL